MKFEVVHASGHANVLSNHRNTLEFTAEEHLSLRGDCIFAVKSDKTMNDLSAEFKTALKNDGAGIVIVIGCNGVTDTVIANGSKDLILAHPTDWVVRKSSFICSRTLAISANKAAADLDRALIAELKKGLPVEIKLSVTAP